MIPQSGIAVFTIPSIGLLRLDDGGLRLIQPTNPDPKLYPKLEKLVADAFAFVDGHHVTAEEAMRHIHEPFAVPAEDVHLVSLTEVELVKPTPGVIS